MANPNYNLDKLAHSLEKMANGHVSLDMRKRLVDGETATLSIHGKNKFKVVREGDYIVLKDDSIALMRVPCVPWDECDEDYLAMIERFDGDLLYVDDFERISENFHGRFDNICAERLVQENGS